MKSIALAFVLFAACGGSPTDATCPTSDAPSYGSFGSAFFSTYCVSCHSSSVSGAARHDAPSDMNFDTEADIISHLSDIDEEAAAGPHATNTDMPELDSDVPSPPTLAERQQLGQFLACEQAAQ
jgi:uncharacterized membrane protein